MITVRSTAYTNFATKVPAPANGKKYSMRPLIASFHAKPTTTPRPPMIYVAVFSRTSAFNFAPSFFNVFNCSMLFSFIEFVHHVLAFDNHFPAISLGILVELHVRIETNRSLNELEECNVALCVAHTHRTLEGQAIFFYRTTEHRSLVSNHVLILDATSKAVCGSELIKLPIHLIKPQLLAKKVKNAFW